MFERKDDIHDTMIKISDVLATEPFVTCRKTGQRLLRLQNATQTALKDFDIDCRVRLSANGDIVVVVGSSADAMLVRQILPTLTVMLQRLDPNIMRVCCDIQL